MRAVTGLKHGNSLLFYSAFRWVFLNLISSLKLILVWIRVRVMVSVSCISAIKTLSSS